MSSWEDAIRSRGHRPARTKLERFPTSAREAVRDQLRTIRLQMRVIGLEEADLELRRAIVAVCSGLNIATYLTAEELLEIELEAPSSGVN